MNKIEQSKIDMIIINIVKNNKHLELNQLKRMIKNKISSDLNNEIASKIGIDYIIDVITENRNLIFFEGKNEKTLDKKYNDESEKER